MTKLTKLTNAEIHELIPETPPEFFCMSPFQNTKQAATDRVSTCAYSSKSFKMDGLTPDEKWNSPELNQRRLDAINNLKPEICNRCWKEEEAGNTSLRQRQSTEYFPDDYDDYIRSGKWISGPNNASFKVSNICNLACRSCFHLDSSFFNKEGLHYADEYDATDTGHNIYYPRIKPSTIDFTKYYKLLETTSKLDFYGGEPMLNRSHVELLQHLIEQDKSKDVSLYYATNMTIPISDRISDSWSHFKDVGFGASLDGVGPHAEYLRWPCKWSEVEHNLHHLQGLINDKKVGKESYMFASYTVSTLNVLHVDDMDKWFTEVFGAHNPYFINMVTTPEHLTIRLLPDYFKDEIRKRVKHPDVLNYLDVGEYDEHWWKKFIIWTKRMDIYRKQDMTTVFPELYDIIKDDWDKVTDLSDENFHNPSLSHNASIALQENN
jgi:sulfatase maturation enzyme AslB (radical SAM superfamily)